MTEAMCEFAERDEFAARYVAGRLGAEEVERFELHFLSCGECRSAVIDAAALHAALARRKRARRLAAGAPLGLAAAAGIAWLLLAPSSLQRLGDVAEPPAAFTAEVRAGADSSADFAARGMAAYQQRQYARAANWLARAYIEHAQPGTGFYLGNSLLASGHADSAAVVFRAVIESGSDVYADESHFYAAKAWLQLGRADSATTHLMHVVRAQHPLSGEARVLLDRIRRNP